MIPYVAYVFKLTLKFLKSFFSHRFCIDIPGVIMTNSLLNIILFVIVIVTPSGCRLLEKPRGISIIWEGDKATGINIPNSLVQKKLVNRLPHAGQAFPAIVVDDDDSRRR